MNKICASIGAIDLQTLQRKIHEAFSLGADFIEIRFDYLKISDVEQAIRIAETIKSKAVFTLRSVDQAGKFKGSEAERLDLLKRLSISKPMLLDVEYNTIRDNDDLADYLDELNTPILVSWHDFEETPMNEALLDIINNMRIYSNYAKVVTTAKDIRDAFRLLDVYENITGLNLIAFAMGEAGVVSRILCTIAGNAPFTYAAVDRHTTASGQISLTQMRRLYDRISISCSSKPNAK